jgi:hypothetical protein
MILIVIAWLLIVAIAFYQGMQGMFSAMVMAVLASICAVFALGTYEWLGPMFLYASQPAYADAISLTLHFVLPLLALRIVFDKVIPDKAAMSLQADRIVGALFGLYVGVVMVGVLTIVLQMLPWGAGVLGYKPYDSSFERNSRIYCDEFALGLFKSSAGLASGNSFTKVHDDFLLELFCARNTAGLNGRIAADPNALGITDSCMPSDAEWKKVVGYDKLPQYPNAAEGDKTDVVIIKTTVANSARSDRKEDGWYRLPATHFRLVTGAGRSYYPLGYLKDKGDKWTLVPVTATDGKADMTGLCVKRQYKSEAYQEIPWVYRLPKMPGDADNLEGDEGLDKDEIERRNQAKADLYAPNYVVFRRTSMKTILNISTKLPETPKEIADAAAKEAADAAAIEAAKRKAKDKKKT